MAEALRAVGVEAFYESPEAERARFQEFPPEVRGMAPAPTGDTPSLRLRVFAEFADGSLVQTSGDARVGMLLMEPGQTLDAHELREAANSFAQSSLAEDLLPDLRDLLPDHSDDAIASTPQEARVNEDSIRAQVRGWT